MSHLAVLSDTDEPGTCDIPDTSGRLDIILLVNRSESRLKLDFFLLFIFPVYNFMDIYIYIY